jgi:hypothetical protein
MTTVMNSKTILGSTLAAIFVLSMTMLPALATGHLTIVESSFKNTGAVSKVTIKTAADIPTTGAFGYGVIGTDRILVVTTHGGVGPDSEAQQDQFDSIFHTHAVTLNFASGVCASGIEVATITFEEFGHLKVKGNTIKITGISNEAAGEITGPFASFELSIIGPANAPTNVCVDNLQLF